MKKTLSFIKDRLRIRGKIIFGAIGAGFLFFLASTQYTYADGLLSIGGLGYSIFGTMAEAIAYILAWIFGVLISVEAWFVGVVLNINNGIMSTSFVQTGFSISLAVANLSFVLGIIVIGIATILRLENYSIKKMLAKLVVMAILVNFGLVIIAPIYALSNSFTSFFLNSINPAGGAGFNGFATTMVARFNPGQVLNYQTPTGGGKSGALGATSGPFSTPGNDYSALGSLMVPIFGLVFTVIDLLLIVFVLAAFIIMLIIRYVTVAILAILLPFAWAAWVFPSFSSMFSKWWNKFLQWTFFAPIFMFFLYLALATIGGSSSTDAFNTATNGYTNSSNTLWQALVNFFGPTSNLKNILTNFLQEVTLTGLIIGGMIAADSMGVKFAGEAVKYAQKKGKDVGLYYGKKTGRAGLKALGGDKLVHNMRTGNLGAPDVIKKIPLIGTGAWTAANKTIQTVTQAPGIKRGIAVAGRAINHQLSNKDLVDEQMKKVPDDPTEIKEDLAHGSMSTEYALASIAKLLKNNESIKDTDMVGNQTIKQFLDSNPNMITDYGFGKSKSDADKAWGSDTGMRTAAAEVEKLAGESKDTSAAMADLQRATNAFLGTLDKAGAAKMNANETLGPNGNKYIARALASGFINVAPHLVSSVLPKMKSPALKNFGAVYRDEYTRELLASTDPDRTQLLDDRWADFQKMITNNVFFGGGEPPAAAPAAPAAPAPSH